MRTVLSYWKNYKIQCLLGPLFKLLEALFELTVPLVIASLIDKGIAGNDSDHCVKCIILLGIFALVGYISAIMAQYFAAYAASGISSELRKDLFHKMQRLSVSSYERIGKGNLVTGLTSDVNQIQSGINLTLRLLLRSPFIVFGAVIMAFTIDMRLALIFVVTVSILGIFVGYNMKAAIPSYRSTREGLDDIVDLTDNGLAGLRVIRGFNRSEDNYKEFEGKSGLLSVLQKKAAGISSFLNPVTYLLINLAVCFLIMRGALRIDGGDLTAGQLIALYNYMSQILVELIKLANLIVTVSRAAACAARVGDLMERADDISDGDIALDDSGVPHSLEFDNVSFTFPRNSEATLDKVSFKAEKGQRIGIIGMTGSGKSTISQLAASLYGPDSGRILIDGIDSSNIRRDSLHKEVGICLQKTKLFSGSLEYNISLGRSFVTSGDIERAVEAACCDDVVAGKDEGLSYVIPEGGSGLSGGQRQRIGIARTLAGSPGLLILDDSTSALDAGTENRLLDNLKRLKESTTIIMISQKIKTIKDCDLIIFMDDGRIGAAGTHEQLMRSSSSYRQLADLQMKAV